MANKNPPSKLKKFKQQWLMEDVAGVSALVHQDKQFQQFYQQYQDALGGFDGIWIWCANAGMAFHRIIDPIVDAKPDSVEWHDILEAYVTALLDAALGKGVKNGEDINEPTWLEPIATAVLYKHSILNEQKQ